MKTLEMSLFVVRNIKRGRVTTNCGLLAAVLLALTPSAAFADGSRLPNQDALAVARGYAFVATASDPSAVYYNPSGLATQPGSEIGGMYVIAPTDSYQGPQGTVDEKGGTFVLPHFFASVPVDGCALGLGAYAPYGLQTDWPDDSGFRNLATSNKLSFTTGALSLARAITPTLSVGASFEVDHLDVKLAQGIGFTPGDLLSYHGSGTSESWNAGLMWSPSPEHHFGVMYESRVNFHLNGTLTESPYGVSEPGAGSWIFPDHLSFGYSFRPTPDWNLEVDGDWTHWSLLKAVTVSAATGPITLPFYWTDSWYYNFGATRTWTTPNGVFSASAGYSYSQNSIPDASFSPALPDMSRNLLAVGGGYRWARWEFNIALERGLPASRTVSGAYPTPSGQSANGIYHTSFNALDVTEQYSW
jgi:long-chain fatty acid transport protein